MATLNQVITGLKKYLDSEMIAKLTGINKWIVGASVSMALDNGANFFNQLKKNEFIKSLDIISKDDEIDVAKIYKYFSEQARKTAVTFTMPIVGTITLKESDVEKIYQSIMESL